jgi:hypothetical protein
LPRGIPTRPRSCCSPEALFHRGESSFIRFPKPKFNGKFQICLLNSPPCDDLRGGPSRPPSGKSCSGVNKPDEPYNVTNKEHPSGGHKA